MPGETQETTIPDKASAPDAQATPAQPPQQQSWGEARKHGTFNFIRNVLVNYIINFTLAATFTYIFDTSKLGAAYREKVAGKFQNKVVKFAINFMTKTQLLLCGGHVLQPFLKWMKDNQQRQEFWMGHKLDQMQEFLGRGNAASKRSLREYERVSELVVIGDHKSDKDASSVKLSDADKTLLAKNHIDDQLHFKEHHQRWWPVIKARLTGVMFTTLTSIGLALWSEAKFIPEKWRFNKIEAEIGKKIGDNVVGHIPLVRSAFNKTPDAAGLVAGRNVTGNQLIGEYFLDDAIYTFMSKLGFDIMEGRNDKKVALEDARIAKEDALRAEAAAAQAERAALRAENALKKETASEVRQKIIAAGPKDAMARAAESQNPPAMALS